jgi:hypothetical protein
VIAGNADELKKSGRHTISSLHDILEAEPKRLKFRE